MLRFLFTTSSTLAMLPIRLALGLIFLGHGSQKVFGAFGGRGFDAWINTPVQINLPAGTPTLRFWLSCAAFAALIGGAMVLFGFMTRIGAVLLSIVMFVALYFVHWRYGFFLHDNGTDGIEYVMALFCCCMALLWEGGGRASVDGSLWPKA
ncbi:MAG: DoxX family protein [Acidobacteria bacterium]|nr:DoxX family protein [Acidobacteriota bacterium]